MGAALELYALRKDGTEFPVEISLSPLKTEDGVLVSNAIRDVSVRKEAEKHLVQLVGRRRLVEEALRESDERYRLLLDGIQDYAIFAMDPLGKILSWNAGAELIKGYSADEIIGRNFSCFFTPGDIKRGRPEEVLRLTAASGRHAERGMRVRKDGSRFLANVTFAALRDPDGNLRGFSEFSHDLSESKESGAKYRGLLEAAPDAMLVVNPDGEIVLLNQQAEKQFGYRRDELIGQKVKNIIPEGFAERLIADGTRTAADALAQQIGTGIELTGRRKDGSKFPIEIMLSPLESADGILVTAAIRDISIRKRAEETLRKSEERFRLIAETIDEVFWIADPYFDKVFYISPGYERVWGRTQASLYENPRSFLEPVHPKDLEGTLLQFEIMKSGKPFDHEYRILRPDGAIAWIWNHGLPVRNEKGEVLRYVGVALDITERKRQEALRTRLLTAIEQAAEGVVVTDAEGVIQYVNPAFSTMTGYSREEVLGKNPRILKSGKHDAAFYGGMWANILAGQVWKGEMINRRKDGSLYTERMSITPVHDEHGIMTHIVAMKEDITAARLLEDQFRHAQKMEAVGRLAAGVTHDFNNLLTVIVGYSEEMLSQFVPGDPLRALATEIKNAGEKAEGLTRQLMAFSRQEVLAPRVLDLNTLIDNLIKILKRLIGEDIDLIFKSAALPATIHADPGLIEQVVMNLAVNSRDAMPRGGKLTIEISHVQFDEAYSASHFSVCVGPYIMLAVSDNGCGMDKDTQAHMFEPFFTTKESGKGTGLGLATVYGIVKQSGGSIFVYSEPGAGTTFKVYLPAVNGACEVAITESAVPATGSETILLVEDNASVRELARMVLVARGGYRVLQSTCGKEALLLAEGHKGPIDLLLTDVVMPGMTGRQLSEELAILRPEMKILSMSGYTDNTVVRNGVLGEGMAFLQKPFTAESLLRKVRSLLDNKPQL
jgi:two-component system cell cycle sensor histidine kinase/response regulator CckA